MLSFTKWHKHELFLCCGLSYDLSELLHNRITFDILNTCASCRRAFAFLSRFWRGVRPLSTVVFVKLNDLKLSLSIAETFQAFNFVNRPLAIILFFQLICRNTCWRWPGVFYDNIRLQQGSVLRIWGGLSLLQYWRVKEGVNCWKHQFDLFSSSMMMMMASIEWM